LRTSEFLWQEGHTAHATREEALEETLKMLEVYRQVVEDEMKIPVIPGEKTPGERFPGAEQTHSIEAMTQDGLALQCGTSHFLGQNFARAAGIQFQDREGEVRLAYTTSWGVSTRLIGAMIMTHGDDDGLRLPPQFAPHHVIILPIMREPSAEAVISSAHVLSRRVASQIFQGKPVRCHVDLRDENTAVKRWDWIKKGVPLICELGPRDLAADSVAVTRRDLLQNGKENTRSDVLISGVVELLNAIETALFEEALAYRRAKTRTDIYSFADLANFFRNEEESGFVAAKWSGDPATEAQLTDLGVTIRCVPHKQSGTKGRCVISGAPATIDAVFGRSY